MDQKRNKLKIWLQDLSLRKTILLYLAIALVLCYMLSGLFVLGVTHVQRQVWMKYVDQDAFFSEDYEDKDYPPQPNSAQMSGLDNAISGTCDFLESYSVLLFSMAGSCIAVFLFYKNKLKKPLAELEDATKEIAGNDLDFHVHYESQDEMGRLCTQFDRMREQLAENNKQLWRQVEDERALRSAIAHDIRSPLTVLKGYQEMLLDYVPDGTIDKDSAMDMLQEGMKQIRRMDHFILSMQKTGSLEHRELKAEPISCAQLEEDIQKEIAVLEKESGSTGEGKCIHLSVEKIDASDSFSENDGSFISKDPNASLKKDSAAPLSGDPDTVPSGEIAAASSVKKNFSPSADTSASSDETNASFSGDKEIILEVLENLLSNALRYAKKQVDIQVSVSSEKLSLSVIDDGEGFQEDAEEVTKAYHQKNIKDSLSHSGMGMYLSRLYCEKHGGKLLLGSSETGGAVVTAVFHRIA